MNDAVGQDKSTTSPLMAILSTGGQGSSQQAILIELRQAILSGEVAPGAPVKVDDVAEIFGVSRIPIRECLKTLIGEGLVDHQPRAGYFVARLTVPEFRELYVVRSALEIAALSAAIDLADSDEHHQAEVVLDALHEAITNRDYRAYQRDSRRFHMALANPCRMPRLLHMIELVWNITEPVQLMAHVDERERSHLHREHREMLVAFVDRNLDRLLAVTRQHLNLLEDSVLDVGASELFEG